ncbi:MAG: pectinesterase family protein [Verrucomicrobia bacterium]|nr:pectinesterase family protein [Verrucomicrobiota bacterium]
MPESIPLASELERTDPGLKVVSRREVTVYVLPAHAPLPLTFAFETAQGGRGLLQIAGFVEEPPSVRLRFRLLSNNAPDAPGAPTGMREATVAQDGSGTHGFIQAALDAVSEGAVVRIGPGRYPERLRIAKSVSLVGAGWDKTVIGPTDFWTGPTAEETQGVERAMRSARTPEDREQLRAEAQARFFQPVVRVTDGSQVRFEGIKFTQPGIAPEGKLLDLAVIEVQAGEVVMTACGVVGSPGNGLTLAGRRERAGRELADGRRVEQRHPDRARVEGAGGGCRLRPKELSLCRRGHWARAARGANRALPRIGRGMARHSL